MQTEKQKQVYRNKQSNAKGHWFEQCIQGGCKWYRVQGIADIEKTPEPFRALEKQKDGSFKGRFTALAQPDFRGTLKGGRSIVFEAKYTSTEKLKTSVLTEKQMEVLQSHYNLGAVVGVCCGIQESFFFIPWEVWRDIKRIFNRQYVTKEDIEMFRIKTSGHALFLDPVHCKQEEGKVWMA